MMLSSIQCKKAPKSDPRDLERIIKRMIKVMKSYRFKKETLKIIEDSVIKINKNIGCEAYDNTKFLESLVYLYSDHFVEDIQTRNKV